MTRSAPPPAKEGTKKRTLIRLMLIIKKKYSGQETWKGILEDKRLFVFYQKQYY
jgi:hypothetical protein